MNLYPLSEARWWSRKDHDAVLKIMRRLSPHRVIEFGPGTSTLALIEGGAWRIDCCEDDPHWLAYWRERTLQPHVAFHPFTNGDPLTIPALDAQRWDMALIDGPLEIVDRFPVIRWCLKRCTHVLVPLEESHGETLTAFCISLLKDQAHCVELMDTGPLAGSFALLTP